VGLLFAHATNNMLNDITDFRKGVDKDNYYRTQYGPQPLESGLMTEKQVYRYVAFNGIIAVLCGAVLVAQTGWITLAFMAAGAFFVLFYTWPLKYIGLGEIAVILVWGPLMVGGGYYAITGVWDANIWNVMIASLPYALGATTVIFGKHIDKLAEDKAKNIHTLPVLIGETAGRYVVIGMMIVQYLSTIYLVITGYFSLWMLAVIPAVWGLKKVLPIFLKPRPKERPADYGEDVWPLWYVAAGFYHNRMFGMLYLVGLILQLVIK